MQLREAQSELINSTSQAFGIFERSPELRWGVVALVWLILIFRFFGRGKGKAGGLFNLYDWAIVLGGMLLLWRFQFSWMRLW